MRRTSNGRSNTETCYNQFSFHRTVTRFSTANPGQIFIEIREKGEVGAFINGFIHFPIGALIVAFHNVWQGIPMSLTIMGYGWVIKGLINFVFPKFAMKSLMRVSPEKSLGFVIAGIMLVGIACLLLYSLIIK